MKRITPLLLMTSLAVCGYAQSSSVVCRDLSAPDLALHAPAQPVAQECEVYHYSDWRMSTEGSYTRARGYRRGLRNRNTGIGLLAGGAASMVVGAALMADGITHLHQDNWNAYGSSLQNAGRFYETYFGAFFGAAGLAMTISSAVVLPRGKDQMRRAKERYQQQQQQP